MKRHLLFLAGVILGGLIWAYPADAAVGKRVALVLGNSGYQNVARLPNPAKDASAIGRMLKDAGFEVIQQLDVGNLEFKRAIRRFGDAMVDADIAVVFYAGHGIEVKGTNYLIPVDAKLASDRDAEDEAVSLDRLVQEIEEAGGPSKQLRLIILDACRDNPFVKTMKQSRSSPSRSRSTAIANGLNAIQPTGSDMLIAYAAKQGSTAEDGEGDHSPFTTALLRSLTVPGLDVRLAFGRVRDDVLKSTGMKQEPFVYGSLGGGVIALVPNAPQAAVAGADQATAKADYDRVAKIGTMKAFEVFVGTYKTGFYADLARAQIDELNKLNQPTMASLPAPPTQSARPNTDETRAWGKIEGTNDISALRSFIDRYPKSPLAITAQDRVALLERNAREREEKANAERQQKLLAEREKAAAEREKIAAQREAALRAKLAEIEQLKTEREAAGQRAADERRAKAAADAERQRVEREAARQHEDDARRAAAAKSDAERKAIEAAAKAADEQRRAKAAEVEQQRVAREAALKREEGVQRSKQDELNAQIQRAEEERKAWVEAERKKDQLAALTSPADKPAPVATNNTPDQVRTAQKELFRLGCYAGSADGAWNDATQSAVRRYHLQQGHLPKQVSVTDELLSDLEKQKSRVCPLVCKDGYVANGEVCVAKEKSKPAPSVASRHDRDRDDRREKNSRQKQAQSKPQARREARSSGGGGYGGGGGGGGGVSGVGF